MLTLYVVHMLAIYEASTVYNTVLKPCKIWNMGCMLMVILSATAVLRP